MAAKDEPKKRKRISDSKGDGEKSNPQKKKFPSNPPNKGLKKPFKSSTQHHKFKSPIEKPKEEAPKSKRERRLQAKELVEARKKKRKPHYTLEQELASMWEKMRRRNISKEDRSKMVTVALEKMKGKIPDIAGSHVSSRVLQTCIKYCSQAERDTVFEELRPHLLTLARNSYAVYLVKKILDNASKKQVAEFISSLHGHVASLLRHMVGSVVVEHVYQLGNATQKRAILMELYSTELQLFKDLVSMKESRLVDIISKLSLQKSSVIRHMGSVLQPILEKGIVDHSIIHRALMEYFSIADQSSAADIIQQLSGPLLVRMIGTRDGSRIGMLCVKHGSAKERKKIIKGMKGHIGKIAQDPYGSMVLVCILSVVDDTKLIIKIVIRELQEILQELVMDKNGRRPLLQLLHPNCTRYFTPEDLASLNLSVPSLCNKDDEVDSSLGKQIISSEVTEAGEGDDKSDTEEAADKANRNTGPGESGHIIEGGKKDPLVRRQELLINSGFAERLIDTCKQTAETLLKSNFGKEVIYEVATGGNGGILHAALREKLDTLHEDIASLVAQPRSEIPEEEHLLENFHSSRTIRKLILDCPSFASILWKKALKGKCRMWAQGHSAKIVCAFLESTDSTVRKMTEEELQPLIDGGILKLPKAKQLAKEG
ncbi:pumilio homolog 24 isoform X2 [Cornus florida]|uniref:pumilio homolog 24 isoform X2 n=1 Tax=Cornus florida TaxID=4283 RepID=UPI00289D2ADB|nr:pumilio homolog 24 isoform X2 [Cornus florida]